MKQIEYIHRKKHAYVLMSVYFVISMISMRLIWLQIIHYQRFVASGEKNFIRFKTIPAQRGNIVDQNRVPLVTNRPTTHIIWKGTGNPKLTQKQQAVLANLASILGTTFSDKYIQIAEKCSRTVLLYEHVSPKALSLIAEQCSDIENIVFEADSERYYPYGSLACHILGYLSDRSMRKEGKIGLEKIFEHVLQGEPGVDMQYINSFGSLLWSRHVKDQRTGNDVVTTLNLSLQQIAEECMKHQKAGVFLLLNPKTGDIPALVSKPHFDPHLLSQKMSVEQWQDLQESRPFVNRAFNATYPPASIFKLVTIGAALEEKIITQDERYHCRGSIMFKGRKYYCNRHIGHGAISLEEGLAYSCNIPCYDIAQKLSIDTLASYAFDVGLGLKTEILFSEKYGLVPTNEWKLAQKGERWWKGETLSAAIGQSFLLVTPIQIACMIGSLFEGYLVKPRILVDQEIEKRTISISETTRLFLQRCMKQTISYGTGKIMNTMMDVTIFAKTGTAQTIERKSKQKEKQSHLEHAWFVSYFYTEKNEPLVLVILLEHVGGARYATSIGKKFFKQYMQHIPHDSASIR